MNKTLCFSTAFCLTLAAASRCQADYSFTTINYPGVSYSATFGISNAGHLVGEYLDASNKFHGYLFSNGVFEDLDYPGSVGTTALGVNSQGDVVGVYGTFVGQTQAFKRIGADYAPVVPISASTFTQATNITDSGHIIGSYYTSIDRGFLFNGTSYTTGLNALGAQNTVALGVNNSDSIVGTYVTSSGARHGFLRVGTTHTTLDYPSMSSTVAYGINDSGQIAGFYVGSDSNFHGFLLSSGVYTTVDVPGSSLTQIRGINNAGQLVGQFTDATGDHGFLATPQQPDADFNNDGAIDAADYVNWRKRAGAVDEYDLWRSYFGQTLGGGSTILSPESASAVPEPSGIVLAAVAPIGTLVLRLRCYGLKSRKPPANRNRKPTLKKVSA